MYPKCLTFCLGIGEGQWWGGGSPSLSSLSVSKFQFPWWCKYMHPSYWSWCRCHGVRKGQEVVQNDPVFSQRRGNPHNLRNTVTVKGGTNEFWAFITVVLNRIYLILYNLTFNHGGIKCWVANSWKLNISSGKLV